MGQAGEPVTPPGAASTVIDPYRQFWFSLPPGWQVQQPPPTEDALELDMPFPRQYATLSTEIVRDDVTLDEYVTVSLARVQQNHPQYRLDPATVQPITLGGKPGRTYSLSDEQGGVPIRVMRFVTLDANVAYMFTLIAPEADADAFAAQAQVMWDTFTFTTSR